MKRFIVFCLILSTPALASIYEDLWHIDQANNGLSATSQSSSGQNQKADIVVAEQAPFQSGKKTDTAPRHLFSSVDEKKLQGSTYVTLQALFDNYVADEGQEEDALGEHPKEDAEIDAFLDAIVKTQVMDSTLKYLNKTQLAGTTFSQKTFKTELKRLWFALFTNHYRPLAHINRPKTFNCSGFEHIFLGETDGGGMKGYHYWYKFYQDELVGNVNYLGYNYKGVSGGEDFPQVVTLAMTWQTDRGTHFRPVTGFLVGPSPELQIAWATLAYFENKKASDTQDVRIPVTLNGKRVELVLYRKTLTESQNNVPLRGNHIRTFYPVWTGISTPKQASKKN